MPAGSIFPEVVAQVITLLRGDGAIATKLTRDGAVQVWNNVPQGTVPPYLWVWSGSEYDAPKKLGPGTYGRSCTVIVVPVSRYRGTREIDELGDLVMKALERQPLVIPEYREAGIVWDETHDPIIADVEGGPQWMRELVFRASAR